MVYTVVSNDNFAHCAFRFGHVCLFYHHTFRHSESPSIMIVLSFKLVSIAFSLASSLGHIKSMRLPFMASTRHQNCVSCFHFLQPLSRSQQIAKSTTYPPLPNLFNTKSISIVNFQEILFRNCINICRWIKTKAILQQKEQ